MWRLYLFLIEEYVLRVQILDMALARYLQIRICQRRENKYNYDIRKESISAHHSKDKISPLRDGGKGF